MDTNVKEVFNLILNSSGQIRTSSQFILQVSLSWVRTHHYGGQKANLLVNHWAQQTFDTAKGRQIAMECLIVLECQIERK